MSDLSAHLPLPYVKINGQVDPKITLSMTELTVESSLYLPDVMTLTLSDPDHKWADDTTLLIPGNSVEISFKSGGQPQARVFDGEIVEIEQVLEAGQRKLIVRAFDRLHRLTYGRHTRTFINVKASDIFSKIGQEVGLSVKTEQTSIVFPHVFQSNQTNMEFLRDLAASVGLVIYVEKKTLNFAKPEDPSNTALTIEWGEDLSEFRPRMSTAHQVNKVMARGWDPKAKQAVVGTAVAKSSVGPQNGVSGSGGATVKKAFALDTELLIVDYPLRTQEEASQLARAVAEQRAGSFIEADGVASGNPKIVAGIGIEIKKTGNKFDGKYFVTSAVHTFTPGDYSTRFLVSGLNPLTLLTLLVPQEPVSIPNGLVIAIVTDNNDPEGLGRVKVKYPWLTEEYASDWARVVSVGGSIDRGMMFLPEVNDEVLIGFEMGDIHHPYVIGGLWNGKDKPPLPVAQAVKSSSVVQRIIKTRSGHHILFDEDGDTKSQITVKTKAGMVIRLSESDKLIEVKSLKHTITLDDGGNVVKVDTPGNFEVKAQGTVKIEGTAGMELKSSASMTVQAQAAMDVKANAALSLQGQASAELKSTGMLTVQGTLVKIN